MNFEDARAAIYSRLNTFMAASYPAIPVRYENRLTVDFATLETLFVAAEIAFTDGTQMALGSSPPVRYQGTIFLNVWERDGAGTSEALGLLDALAVAFKTAQFGGVNTKAPRPMPGAFQPGWYVLAVRIPFWFDQM